MHAGKNLALQHQLGLRGHLDVDGAALHELDGRPSRAPATSNSSTSMATLAPAARLMAGCMPIPPRTSSARYLHGLRQFSGCPFFLA